jgi:hypothetical protein
VLDRAVIGLGHRPKVAASTEQAGSPARNAAAVPVSGQIPVGAWVSEVARHLREPQLEILAR